MTALAGDGLYREPRHFTAWSKERQIETHKLHQVVREVTGQATVPIGDFILETPDTSVTCETCEELVGYALYFIQNHEGTWSRNLLSEMLTSSFSLCPEIHPSSLAVSYLFVNPFWRLPSG